MSVKSSNDVIRHTDKIAKEYMIRLVCSLDSPKLKHIWFKLVAL